ncbi:hypothetical protein ACHWQZ_G009000 [Mnemiopsis leidyi]
MPNTKDPALQQNPVPPTLPKLNNLSKICIIVDTSLLEEETFMKTDCFIFYHPLSLSVEDCQTIAGNMITIYDILSSLQKSSVPTLTHTAEYKMGLVKIHTYFVVLSGPPDMSNSTMLQQVKLFIDSLIFFLGPPSSLHIQHSADQIRVMIRKVARHIVNCVIPDRGVTFRNNVGYLPSKSNVPPDCLLRCSTLLDSLQIFGGVVVHDRKLVYTNLDSCILAVLLGLDENNVPVDCVPSLEKVSIVRVFMTTKMWTSLKAVSSDESKLPEVPSEKALDLMLEGLDLADSHRLNVRKDSLTPIVNSYELVPLDIPEEEFSSSSRPFFRSMSSQHSKFSLLNELFDHKKGREGDKLKRSATVASITYETLTFHDSVESQLSGSDLPGNSLNYKLLTREDDVIPSPPSNCDIAPDSPQVIKNTDKPSDSNSGDSAYHDSFDFFLPHLTNSEFRVCELLIQSRVNTTVMLLGENLSENVQKYWSTCLKLLGDVSGFFDVEMRQKPQKTTQGVNTFVFDRLTKTLLHSNAGKTSLDSHLQIKECKEWCDDDSEIEVVGVRGLNCSTVVKNTGVSNVFLTSHSIRCSKLADNISDITGRNFDSVFL